MSSLVEFKHEFGAHSLVNDVVVDSARCYLYDTVQASTAFFKDWKVSKKDREFLDSVTFFYEHSFKGCPYFSDIRQDGTYEKTCPFSGQALVAASHNYKVIHVPLVGLRRVCCKSSDIKVENIVSTFFKPINREMGPYDFFDSTNVETPGLNTPDSKLPDHMSSLSITYSKELTKLIVSCDLRDRHKSPSLDTMVELNPGVDWKAIIDERVPHTLGGLYIKDYLNNLLEKDFKKKIVSQAIKSLQESLNP